jgi:hypothetical protein
LKDFLILVFIPENDSNEMFNGYGDPALKEVIPDLNNRFLGLKNQYADNDDLYHELQAVHEKYYVEGDNF